jgi:SAM-dependent methyltransferase
MTVADLGCGTGRLVPFLSRNFKEVVAIDYAPTSLALARRGFVGDGVVFRRRDLRDLTPFRRAFDVAVAIDSIVGPRIEDVDRILAQVHRSLKEGGMFVGTFPAAPPEGEPVPMYLTGHEPGAPMPLALHEVELQYRLRRAGFYGVGIRRFHGTDSQPGSLLCQATRRTGN